MRVTVLPVCMCVPGPCGIQEMVSDALGLELQSVVSTKWVLGIEPQALCKSNEFS